MTLLRTMLLGMLLTLPAIVGCAAAGNLTAEDGPKVYGGTQTDMALISGKPPADADPADVKKVSGSVRTGAACCGLVDLPFSLVADTLTLPITVPMSATRARHADHPEAREDDEEDWSEGAAEPSNSVRHK